MLIRNVQNHDLYDALHAVNEQFDNNVIFNRCDYAGETRQGGNKYNVTLRVKSSRAPGHRLSAQLYIPGTDNDSRKPRHLVAACWHIHRAFLAALPNSKGMQVEVVSTFGKWHPGEPFLDANVGNYYHTVQASELCECNSDTYDNTDTDYETAEEYTKMVLANAARKRLI